MRIKVKWDKKAHYQLVGLLELYYKKTNKFKELIDTLLNENIKVIDFKLDLNNENVRYLYIDSKDNLITNYLSLGD